MGAKESFDSQLKAMEQERQNLAQEIRQLKDEEERVAAKEASPLAAERKDISGEIAKLHSQLWESKQRIGQRNSFLQEWDSCKNSSRNPIKFAENLKRCFRTLKQVLRSLPADQKEDCLLQLMHNVKKFDDAAYAFKNDNAIDKEEMAIIQTVMQKKQLQFDAISKSLAVIASRFKQEITGREEKQRRLSEKIRSMQQLNIQNCPPAESNLIENPCPPVKRPIRIGNKKAAKPEQVAKQAHHEKQPAWKFFIGDRELPQAENDCIKAIKEVIGSGVLPRGLRPGPVYKEFVCFTKMDQQMYLMNRELTTGLPKRKTGKYRLLFSIDKERQEIRLASGKLRKNAYPGHH